MSTGALKIGARTPDQTKILELLTQMYRHMKTPQNQCGIVKKVSKAYAAACEMLYEMEVELGLNTLPYHQKRLVQVASSVASDNGKFETAEVMELLAERYGMSRATFFRSLAGLKVLGMAVEVRPGTYNLALPR